MRLLSPPSISPSKEGKKGDFLFSFSDFFFLFFIGRKSLMLFCVHHTMYYFTQKKGAWYQMLFLPPWKTSGGGRRRRDGQHCLLCCVVSHHHAHFFSSFISFDSPQTVFFYQVRIERLFWNFPIEKKIRFFLSLFHQSSRKISLGAVKSITVIYRHPKSR